MRVPFLIVIPLSWLLAFFSFLQGEKWLSILGLSSGLILLLVLLWIEKQNLKDWFLNRRTKLGLNESLRTLLVLAALLLSYAFFVSDIFHYRLDLTGEKIYSLSTESLEVLKKINFPVKVEVYDTSRGEETVLETLHLFQNANSFFKVEKVDMVRDPLRAKERRVSKKGTLVFLCTNHVPVQLTYTEMIKDLMDTSGRSQRVYLIEEKLIAVLKSLTEGDPTPVYFLSGHGEKRLDDGSEAGLSRLRESLKMENLSPETLTSKMEIPSDAKLLVVAGPRAKLDDKRLAEIDVFLKNGGSALLLLDPLLETQKVPSGLETMLAEHGLISRNDIVFDPYEYLTQIAGVKGSPLQPILHYGSHPVVKALSERGFDTAFFSAHSFEVTSTNWTPILLTSDKAVGIGRELKSGEGLRFDPKTDRQGPLIVGVLGEIKWGEKTSRLAVLGDSDFLRNPFFELPAHRDLIANIIRYLAGREAVYTLRPKLAEKPVLRLSAAEQNVVLTLALIFYPLLVLGLGLSFVIYRKRLSSKAAARSE